MLQSIRSTLPSQLRSAGSKPGHSSGPGGILFGVGVGMNVGVGVGASLEVGVGVGVEVETGVGVGMGVEVGVEVGCGVAVGRGVAVGVGCSSDTTGFGPLIFTNWLLDWCKHQI